MAAREKTYGIHLLLLLLLVFSHLIISVNAIPITRTRNLMHGTQSIHPLLDSMNTQLENAKRRWEIEAINRRMNVELNDYPGSGANNRHTPVKPQVGRVCVDC